MSTLWIVLPLASVFAGIAVAAFIWTVRSGQLDDLETPALRALVDDMESDPGNAGGGTTRSADEGRSDEPKSAAAAEQSTPRGEGEPA